LKLTFLFILGSLFLLNSCVVVDLTKHQSPASKKISKVCTIHQKKMKKTLVRTSFGLSAYDFDVENSKFPNAKREVNLGCVQPSWPIHRMALIYSCWECTQRQQKIVRFNSAK
jgi:hypothetical protein